MAKKEITVQYVKNVNDAWCGIAYFINPTLGKKTAFTAAAGPHEKRAPSIAWINQRLEDRTKEMCILHKDWRRVTSEEFDNFSIKK